MRRREFIAAAAIGGVAGCVGGPGGSDGGTPGGEIDGYPSPSTDRPTERPVDVDAFDTVSVEGVDVPLVPVDVAHYWHRRREARFADARGRAQYERSHVLGAVLSTAPDGVADDPVATWPVDDRIVCYCGCPHHLSSLRAATLAAEGYERVYVIDEGFWEWHGRAYPVAGTAVTDRPRLRVVRGDTAPAHAGESVLAVHEPSGQREAAPVAPDGTYELHLRFAGVDDASVVTLVTPLETVRAPLGSLADGRAASEAAGRGGDR